MIIIVITSFLLWKILSKEPNDFDTIAHDGLFFDYPTVGIPIPGNIYNNTKVAKKDVELFEK